MFAYKKLLKLKPFQRKRKIIQVFRELIAHAGPFSAVEYSVIDYCLETLKDDIDPDSSLFHLKDSAWRTAGSEEVFRSMLVKSVSLLENSIGDYKADWDLADPAKNVNGYSRIVTDMELFLDGIRSPYNLGAIFRSAESFGIKKIWLSGECCSPEHERARKTSRSCTELIPWQIGIPDLSGYSGNIFAMETGGNDLETFSFPVKGLLVIGSEEWGIAPEWMQKCKESAGIVSIKTGGQKGSLNVSVATGIVLQKWFSKCHSVLNS